MVGNVKIGSFHPVSIQSMTKTHTFDIAATVSQAQSLEKAGCELVRVAVKDIEDAKAISDIKKEIKMPLIADIHFDHELALEAIERGANKIRINPGNIQREEDIDKVVGASARKGIPIRVGVNSGSLMEVAKEGGTQAAGMVKSLLSYLEHFRRRKFNDIVVSLKSSDVSTMVEAYRGMANECDYPFHLGVTASGLPAEGIVKSSMGIGSLLLDGIGDTIRVSLTGDPRGEIDTARRILASAGTRHFGPEIIACPTCGRCQVDLVPIVKELEAELKKRCTMYDTRCTKKPPIIAVMGCEVNGPGEAKEADIGIAFGNGKGAIFCDGAIVKTVKVAEAVKELINMIGEKR